MRITFNGKANITQQVAQIEVQIDGGATLLLTLDAGLLTGMAYSAIKNKSQSSREAGGGVIMKVGALRPR